jgi:hypothetical protein
MGILLCLLLLCCLVCCAVTNIISLWDVFVCVNFLASGHNTANALALVRAKGDSMLTLWTASDQQSIAKAYEKVV